MGNNHSATPRRTRKAVAAQLKSGDGMVTSAWGPPLWFMLHRWAANTPLRPNDDDTRRNTDLLLNLKSWLPCGPCRQNYDGNLRSAIVRFHGNIAELHRAANLFNVPPPPPRRARRPISTRAALEHVLRGGRLATMFLLFQLHASVSAHLQKPPYPLTFVEHVADTVQDRATQRCQVNGCRGGRQMRVSRCD